MTTRTTHSSTQTKARKRALDILFEADLRESDALATLAERSADAEPPVRDFTAGLVKGVSAHRDDIDARIVAALADDWSLQRLPRVDRTIMRIAVFEIDHTTGEPVACRLLEIGRDLPAARKLAAAARDRARERMAAKVREIA
jgi:N utilization substance protein B